MATKTSGPTSMVERLKNNSTIKETALLEESLIYGKGRIVNISDVPMLNVALSGELDGGLTSGLSIIAGPSKQFKSKFALLLCKAFLEKYEDGVVLFYDNEFGTPASYVQDLPSDRILHSPFTDVEQLKIDITKQLLGMSRGDNVLIFVDSIGNAASRKEVDDALEAKTNVDMTRAKQIKSLFRIVTPHLAIKDIPMVVVNHSYKTMDLFSRETMSGGTGPMLAANIVWMISRRQDASKKNKVKVINGYEFDIKIEKGRFVREGTKITVGVSFDEGVDKYSSVIDNATEFGMFRHTNDGFFIMDPETGEFLDVCFDTENKACEFLLTYDKFRQKIADKFALRGS